jgi:hypothetical protein
MHTPLSQSHAEAIDSDTLGGTVHSLENDFCQDFLFYEKNMFHIIT